jgi:O-succinylbenzoic acid--CoA ligase
LIPGLQIAGRIDGAIHSGGETVFPEQLEERLMAAIQSASLPVSAVLLLGVDDPEWGQRLVALVCSTDAAVLPRLEALTLSWSPAETPRRWLLCPDLAPSALGKWQRQRWREWLERLDAAEA